MNATDRFAQLVNRVQAGDHLELVVGLIGVAFEPSVDLGSVVRGLDELAEHCQPTFDGVVHGLFGTGRLVGNREHYHDPANSFLHEVLRRGLGMPITLSVVAVEVGRRLGVPIEPMGLPGHFMVRDRDSGQWADPFNGGTAIAADRIEAVWRQLTGSAQPWTGAMLVPSPPRVIAVRILNNLRVALERTEDHVGLATLVRLRRAFPELADSERKEHAIWMAPFN